MGMPTITESMTALAMGKPCLHSPIGHFAMGMGENSDRQTVAPFPNRTFCHKVSKSNCLAVSCLLHVGT